MCVRARLKISVDKNNMAYSKMVYYLEAVGWTLYYQKIYFVF